jgi:CSLREA domain-containing protein
MARHPSPHPPVRPIVEELEARILYSGDLAPAFAAPRELAPEADYRLLDALPEAAPDNDSIQIGRLELVVVDADVDAVEMLLAGLSDDPRRQFEIIRLTAGADGISQLGQALGRYGQVSAIHVFAHGDAGRLRLGDAWLDAAALDTRAAEIAAWGDALTLDADILVYGCDVAAGATGQSFVMRLAGLTGADVAASDDLTGNAALGGDWDLETRIGQVDAGLVGLDAWQGALPTSGEIRVNQTTVGVQSLASQNRGSGQAIGMAANGDFVVVWTSEGQDGALGGVYARLFNADGTANGNEFQVNTTTADAQQWAVVDMSATGEFIVAWTSRNQASAASGDDIYYKRFAADGSEMSGEIRANSSMSGIQAAPSIALLEGGGVVIAWHGEGPGDTDGIFFRRFDAADSAVDTADQRVNITDGTDENDPSVAPLPGGGFVVFWETDKQMYFRRFDSAGAALDAGAVQVDNDYSTSSGAAVAADAAGNYTAVYREERILSGVWGRGYTASGGNLHTWFYAASGAAISPDIAIAPDGAYIVTYQNSGDGDATGVYARKYNTNGSTDGSSFLVNQTTTGAQTMPAIAALDTDRYIIAWSGGGPGDADGVFVRVFDDTTLVLPVIGSDGGGDSAALSVAEGQTAVTTVVAVPEDGSTVMTLSYSLNGGADQAKFQIDPSTGALSFINAPDYEAPGDVGADNIYNVTVQVNSNLGGLDLQDIAVTVTDANDAPVITNDGGGAAASLTCVENTAVATTVTATDIDLPAQTLTYAISGGADAARFQIDPASGVLSFLTAPDFENPADENGDNVYQVTVTVSDGSLADSQDINVTVTNQAITSIATTGNTAVSAGASYTLNISADEDATSWTINWGDGAIERFPGDPASVTHVYNDPGFTFNILASATDAAGTILQNQLLVPTYTGGDSVFRFAATTGTFIEEFAIGDGLNNAIQAIIGPDGMLYVSGEASSNVLRYDPASSAFIDAFVPSGRGGLNEAGGIAFGPDGNLYVASYSGRQVLRYDGASGAFIDVFITTGTGNPYSLTFGPDGRLYVGIYNHDEVRRYNGSTGAYIDTFVSAGSGGLDTPEQITFGPDGDLYVASYATDQVLRYDGATGAFLNAFVSAGAGGLDKPTGVAFGPDGNLYVTGETTNNVLRYDGATGAYIDQYVATGSGGLSTPTLMTFLPDQQVTVISDNQDPAITSDGGGATATLNVAENSTAVTTVTATDSDLPAQTLSYSISGGADAARFSVDASSGALRFVGAPNYEVPTDSGANNVYEVTVQVSDGNGGSDSQTLAVTVTDIGNTLTVTTTADTVNGSTSSIEALVANPGSDGKISLREAILAANATPGVDTISFDIATPLVNDAHTIALGSALPAISEAAIIDGTTEPDYHGTPIIELNGAGAGSGSNGMTLSGNGSTLRGLVINRFSGNGIAITGNDNVVESSYIGLGVDGVTDRGNTQLGIAIDDATGNRIGGVGSGNVISGNGYAGMAIRGSTSSGNLVLGNRIGTDATGTLAVGNDDYGIDIWNNGPDNNTVGGALAGEGNLISGNAWAGVHISGSGTTGNTVIGNTIGTDITGELALGNGSSGTNIGGIDIDSSASGNIIGGSTDGAGNRIAFNTGPGIKVEGATTGNSLRGNRIFSNSGLGIDLGNDGVTTNDTGDGDSGANAMQNFPVLTDASILGSDLTVTGSLNSGAARTFVLDFYASATADASAHGEAERYLGSTTATTSSSGNATFTATLPGASVAPGVFITATATDTSGNTSEFATNVIAAPMNNAPTADAGGPYVLDEGASLSLDARASTDPDADTLTYAWDLDNDGNYGEPGEPTTSTATVSWTTLRAFGVADNGAYTLGLRVSDGRGGVATDSATLTVDNVAPTITSPATVSLAENSSAVQTVTATDPNDPVTFAIAGGADAGAFSIHATTGVLSFVVAPDHEIPTDAGGDNVYDVTVQVSDGDGGTDTQAIAVSVNPLNDNAPRITSDGGGASAEVTVPENGTAVTMVSATDADLPAQTLNYSLAGGVDAALFQIDTTSGALSFKVAPDYEAPTDSGADNVYEVDVQVSDGTLTDTQAIAVTVTPVNDTPPDITSDGGDASAVISVTENSTGVTTVTATDTDRPAQSLTYSIVGGADAGMFEIDPNSGALSFKAPPDYETPADANLDNVYVVDIRVTDGALSDDQSLAIGVLNQNEAGVGAITDVDGPVGGSVEENAPDGASVGITAHAADPDTGVDTVSYSLDQDAGGRFAIDALNGVVTVANGALVDYENVQSHAITVRATSTDGSYTTANFTIDILPLNDNSPVITSGGGGDSATFSIEENTALVTTVTASDADLPPQTLTYSLAGGADQALFQIDANNGILSFKTAPDYETPLDTGSDNVYDVTVQISDGDGGSDSQTLTVTVVPLNDNAPVLNAIGNQTIVEGSTLTFTATATDNDVPPDTLTYSLGGTIPAGASISAAGVFTWTPSEAQGPNTYSFDVIVSDGQGGSDSETIQVTVSEGANQPPVLDPIGNQTVTEGNLLTFTATASDPDVPPGSLSYSLSGAPAGAGIDPTTGVFTWTPSEAQGPNTYSFDVLVSDGQGGSDSETIQVTVGEGANQAPDLDPIGNQTVTEGNLLTFTATATDPDVPPGALTYSLSGAPAGASIDPTTGVFTWTPSEAQGPNTSSFDVLVSDGQGGTDSETIQVTVSEGTNQPPVLDPIGNQTVTEGNLLTFTATASDPDVPPGSLSYSLSGAPAGAGIDPTTGVFTWTPSEAQGPNTYSFDVIVSDGQGGTDSETIQVTISEGTNQAPDLDPIGNQTVTEGNLLTFTATATDPDVPPGALTYSLGGSVPSGASIDANSGVFTWTPTEAQGPGSYTFDILVSDGQGGSDSETITVTVSEGANQAPVLDAIGDRTVAEGNVLSFTATATDPDVPPGALTYSLGGSVPSGASIDANSGVFTWTPTETQGPGVYTFDVLVSDGQGGSDSETITVTVSEGANQAPVLDAIGDQSVAEGNVLSFTASATDPDVPPGSLSYSLGGSVPSGASIDADSGVFTWTPTEAQGPGSYTFDVLVSDGQGGSDSETITVTVSEGANQAPVLDAIGDQSVAEGMQLSFTASATDPDVPPGSLSYSLGGSVPSGASIDANSGVFTWTPTEAQGPGSYTFDILVSDGQGGSDSETITVTVSEGANQAPVLDAIGDRTVAEGNVLSFTATATDPDVPPGALTYSLGGSVPSGASIDANSGVFTWTPTETQGPGVYTFDVLVSDGQGGSDSETITVTVSKGANQAPVLDAIGDQSVAEGMQLSFTASATDPDVPPGSLSYSLVGSVPSGVSIDANSGIFTWTPTEAQGPGSYTFDVLVSDGSLSDSETITITVLDGNHAPRITSDASFSLTEGTLLVARVSAEDADTPPQPLVYSISAGVDASLFAIDALTGDLSFLVAPAYESPADADGDNVYQLTVAASDGELLDTQQLLVRVIDGNRAPEAVLDAFEGEEDGSINGNVLSNDSDADGDVLRAGLVSGTQHGRLVLYEDGHFDYLPDADYSGADRFSYRLDDGVLSADEVEVSLTVTSVNDAPVLMANRLSIVGGERVILTPENLVAVDIDSEASVLRYTVDSASNGHFELLNAPGSRISQFSPAQVAAGAVVFVSDSEEQAPRYAIQVEDGEASFGPESAEIDFRAAVILDLVETVAPVNAAPDAADEVATEETRTSTETSGPSVDVLPEPSLVGAGFVEAPVNTLILPGDARGAMIVTHLASNPVLQQISSASPVLLSVPFQLQEVRLAALESMQIQALEVMKQGLGSTDYVQALDKMRESIDARSDFEAIVIGSSVAVSSGLSIGYVLWLLRGGALLGSLLSALPAWTVLDPVPVLAYYLSRGRHRDEDDALSERMFENARKPAPIPPPDAPEPADPQSVTKDTP